MAMSRKDFVAMAIEFGDLKRWTAHSGSTEITSVQLNTIDRCINAYMRTARQANSNFDSGYFVTFVDEVASGERDLDGKKVKKSKKVA